MALYLTERAHLRAPFAEALAVSVDKCRRGVVVLQVINSPPSCRRVKQGWRATFAAGAPVSVETVNSYCLLWIYLRPKLNES